MEIDETISHYRIVGELGRGGSGVVYRAVDLTLNRDVAIKVLLRERGDPEAVARFQSEATILARLNHPDIATIYELFRSESDLLMVMEFVRGETLDRLTERLGPLAPDRAAYVVDRILSALHHAHQAGVVHRDMKPANVMVTESGAVKVMDFGIARVRGGEHLTLDGSMLGTPAYMSPEQVLSGDVDGRGDVYSVGVILYRLLTAALPFDGDTPVAMLQRQLSEPPLPLAARRPSLPAWCETIVQRALAKAPADRYQTAEDFRTALVHAAGIVTTTDLARAFTLGEDKSASAPRQASAPTIVITDARGEATRTDSAASGASALRRKRVAWTVAALAAFATGLALVTDLAVRRPAEPTRRPAVATRKVPEFPGRVAFNAKTLEGTGRRQRKRDARLVLAEGGLSVTAEDDRKLLHAVSCGGVTSISSSRGRDPMWDSPVGPALVTRAEGGFLRALGISVDHNWISLGTDTKDRFIVLQVGDEQVRRVLAALEECTGLITRRISG